MATENFMPRSAVLREALDKSGKAEPVLATAVSVKDACAQLGIGKTTLYGLIARKEIASMKVKGRRLISQKAIERFVEQREKEEAEA
jgi:excisionase family DNA binding protein